MIKIGRWKRIRGPYLSPGGTPGYECGACGQGKHLHGAEYPKRMVVCDGCGRINIYPGEKAYEQGTPLWEEDEA